MARLYSIPLLLMVTIMVTAPLSGCIAVFKPDGADDSVWDWIDPVVEIEDDNHSHIDLLSHRLNTPNAKLITT